MECAVFAPRKLQEYENKQKEYEENSKIVVSSYDDLYQKEEEK